MANFVQCFSCISLDYDTVSIHSVNVIYHTDWPAGVKPFSHPTWSRCMILLTYSWILFNNILWRNLCLSSSEVLGSNFLLLQCPRLVWYQRSAGLIKKVSVIPLYSMLWKNLRKVVNKFFLNCLVEPTKEAVCFWTFVSWDVLLQFIHLTRNWSFLVFCFLPCSCSSSQVICMFVCPFLLVCPIGIISLFLVVSNDLLLSK